MEYVRKIAYLFHYRNKTKEESAGYIKLAVRNGQGSLTVRLRPYGSTAAAFRVCLLSEGGQAEEAGLVFAKEEVFEAIYLYEGEMLAKLETLAGVCLLAEDEEYYGARFDGRDVTEQMIRGALSAHVQSFAEEFARASWNGKEGEVSEEVSIPCLGELRASEIQEPETIEASVEEEAQVQYERMLGELPVYRPFEEASFPQSVRIVPEDIRRFPKEARPLAENSFLLHGFYRYRHLLLVKKQEEEGVSYLLMVPGIFHYRDSYLAGLFGFSSFLPIREESRREKKKQGEFGYWYLTLAGSEKIRA